MQILLQSTDYAKSLAKSLRRSLASDGIDLKLADAQRAVARMLGYADHRALCASAGQGDPDPYEDELTPESASARRETFATRLAEALGVPLARARALVEAIGPLRRSWKAPDDWKARRQAYFAQHPLADMTDQADFQLWGPLAIPPYSPTNIRLTDILPKRQADPKVFGPKAYTVDIAFGHEILPGSPDPVPVPEKTALGIEYVYAKIAMGDRVLGWLQGVVADLSSVKTREDLKAAAELLDGPRIDVASSLFEWRLAMEVSDFGNLFKRIFVVTDFVRDVRHTPPGAGAALFAQAADAVVARFEGPFCVVLNATPPQYLHPARLQGAGLDGERLTRSTGRAAAARNLRQWLLALPLPDAMKDVSAFDLTLPYMCAVPYASTCARPIDAPGDVFDFHDERPDPEGRTRARALFGDTPDPTLMSRLVDERSVIRGFNFDEVMAVDRDVQPHSLLWGRMPKALVRIEVLRGPGHRNWTRVGRAMMDPEALMQHRPPLPRLPVDTDTAVFVFANGTQACVPDRQFAHADFGDVIGSAFTDTAGDPLSRNPYTDEMSIGDLWSVLTANAALLYSGGEPVPFRDGRIVLNRPANAGSLFDESEWLTNAQAKEHYARYVREREASGGHVPGDDT